MKTINLRDCLIQSLATRSTLTAGVLMFILAFTSGCASYHVTPDAAAIVIPKAATPIPITVGLAQVVQDTNMCSDFMPKITKQFEECGLFQKVFYPVRADDHLDGQLVLHLNEQFKTDGALFAKAFLTGFLLFLPAPLVTYTHEYRAEGTLDLVRDKQTLKSYNYNVTVDLTHKIFAPAEGMTAALEAAAPRALSAELIQQLLNDRPFLEKALIPTNAAAR